MLQHNSLFEKQEQEFFSSVFAKLKVSKLLNDAGIKKATGYSAFMVFKIIFQLVFLGKNWDRFQNSNKSESYPAKDVAYRFLNSPNQAWRKFLHRLSLTIVHSFEKLTSSSRTKVFIVDDSVLSRNRSKKVELLAKVYDHTINKFIKGHNMLALGWSDGYSFLPIDFSVLSSPNAQNRYCGIAENVDQRTHGYKRRKEALFKKTDALVQLVENALNAGFSADYVLMDSWFTHAPVLKKLKDMGLDVIGMVKPLKQKYLYKGQYLTLKELYAKLPKMPGSQVISSVTVETSCGLPLKLVFVKNRHNKREWLALLSTDLTLDDNEIVRIYGNRWDIEVFFKFSKSFLKLSKEFEGRSFDMIIGHTTIVFARYLILEWEHRNNSDDRSFGGLFYLYCEEVSDMDFKTALQQLMDFVLTFVNEIAAEKESAIKCQLQELISGFPSYIRNLFADLRCES